MKTYEQLSSMCESELISEVLKLQKIVKDMTPEESKASCPSNYHFCGAELFKLHRDKMLGSGVIMTLSSIKGKTLVPPIMLSDGLSTDTVNSLLEDFQYSFDQRIQFTPITKRLK